MQPKAVPVDWVGSGAMAKQNNKNTGSQPAKAKLSRQDIGSWLQGPKEALAQQGIEFGYPGNRLGLPETGVGSVARMGRRIAALAIDWLASNLLVSAFFTDLRYGSSGFARTALIAFGLEVLFFTALLGASFGQQVLGIGVRQVNGNKLGLIPVVIRTILLVLVVPALIWDRDGRGLHDKMAQSVVVKTR